MSAPLASTPPTLDGTRLLVVGASSGIGHAFANCALGDGASVAVAARRADRLSESFGDSGATIVGADATDPDDARRMVAESVAGLGRLDLVLYAAGTGTLAPLADTDPDAWARDHAVNVIGANLVCGAALEHMSHDGVVAFVSSRGPIDNHWGLSSYASSKAALDTTIEGWRVEHPDRRFVRIVMGNVMPTEFAAGYDPEIATVALSRWPAQGIPLDVMEVGDVGAALAGLLAVVIGIPGIDLSDIRLDARRPGSS